MISNVFDVDFGSIASSTCWANKIRQSGLGVWGHFNLHALPSPIHQHPLHFNFNSGHAICKKMPNMTKRQMANDKLQTQIQQTITVNIRHCKTFNRFFNGPSQCTTVVVPMYGRVRVPGHTETLGSHAANYWYQWKPWKNMMESTRGMLNPCTDHNIFSQTPLIQVLATPCQRFLHHCSHHTIIVPMNNQPCWVWLYDNQ